MVSGAIPDLDTYEVDPGPVWRGMYREEYAKWIAKSYDDLRAELTGVCCVHYEREQSGDSYGVDVQLLENLPEYVHVALAVCGPKGWAGASLSTSFIRYADGRIDA